MFWQNYNKTYQYYLYIEIQILELITNNIGIIIKDDKMMQREIPV